MKNHPFIERLKKSLAAALSLALLTTSSGLSDAAAPSVPQPLYAQLTPSPRMGYLVDHFEAPAGPLVVLIQDLHAHEGVQKHIASLLDFLCQKLNPSGTGPLPFALAVEGASGPIDSSVLATFPDQSIKRRAANYLLKQGELSGAEYFAAMSGLPTALTGVEEPAFYTLHRDLFRKTYPQRERDVRRLRGMRHDLNELKRKAYPPALRLFERRLRRFEDGTLALTDLLAWLEKEGRQLGLDLGGLRTSSASEFNAHLASVSYLIKLELARRDPKNASLALDLLQVDHDLALLLKVADLQATEQEVKTLGPRVPQFIALASGLLAKAGQPNDQQVSDLRTLISSSIDYYALAMMRNGPMVEHTLTLLDDGKKTSGSPRPRVAVLVAGGFHTRPITQLLKERQVSYVVLSPAVDEITPAQHALYVQRLNGILLTEADVVADRAALQPPLPWWKSIRENAAARFRPGSSDEPHALAAGVGIISAGVLLTTLAVSAYGVPDVSRLLHEFPSYAAHLPVQNIKSLLYAISLAGAGMAVLRPGSSDHEPSADEKALFLNSVMGGPSNDRARSIRINADRLNLSREVTDWFARETARLSREALARALDVALQGAPLQAVRAAGTSDKPQNLKRSSADSPQHGMIPPMPNPGDASQAKSAVDAHVERYRSTLMEVLQNLRLMAKMPDSEMRVLFQNAFQSGIVELIDTAAMIVSIVDQHRATLSGSGREYDIFHRNYERYYRNVAGGTLSDDQNRLLEETFLWLAESFDVADQPAVLDALRTPVALMGLMPFTEELIMIADAIFQQGIFGDSWGQRLDAEFRAHGHLFTNVGGQRKKLRVVGEDHPNSIVISNGFSETQFHALAAHEQAHEFIDRLDPSFAEEMSGSSTGVADWFTMAFEMLALSRHHGMDDIVQREPTHIGDLYAQAFPRLLALPDPNNSDVLTAQMEQVVDSVIDDISRSEQISDEKRTYSALAKHHFYIEGAAFGAQALRAATRIAETNGHSEDIPYIYGLAGRYVVAGARGGAYQSYAEAVHRSEAAFTSLVAGMEDPNPSPSKNRASGNTNGNIQSGVIALGLVGTGLSTLLNAPVLAAVIGIASLGALGWMMWTKLRAPANTVPVPRLPPPEDHSPVPDFRVGDTDSQPPSLDATKLIAAKRVDLNQLPVGTLVTYDIEQGHWSYTLRIEEEGQVSLWLRQDRGRIVGPVSAVGTRSWAKNTEANGILEEHQQTYMPYFHQTPFGEGERHLERVGLEGFDAAAENIRVQLPENSPVPSEAIVALSRADIERKQQAILRDSFRVTLLLLFNESLEKGTASRRRTIAHLKKEVQEDAALLGLLPEDAEALLTFLASQVAELRDHPQAIRLFRDRLADALEGRLKGGALKRMGPRTSLDDYRLLVLDVRHAEFRTLAARLAHEGQIIKDRREDVDIEVIEASLLNGVYAYHVPPANPGSPLLVIVRPDLPKELRREAIFHEIREYIWKQQENPRTRAPYTPQEAHALASADQVLDFGHRGVTPFHQWLMERMKSQDLRVLENESAEQRRRHHALLIRAGFHIALIVNYETQVREEAARLRKLREARKPPTDRFEIGERRTSHGHKIAGGESRGRRGGREVIVVDWNRDPALNELYRSIRYQIDVLTEGRPGALKGIEKGSVLEHVMWAVMLNVQPEFEKWEDYSREREGEEFLIGEAMTHGGVCRHMGILSAALLERLIEEGVLSGQVYYVRGNGHGWAAYRSTKDEYFVFDAAQQVGRDVQEAHLYSLKDYYQNASGMPLQYGNPKYFPMENLPRLQRLPFDGLQTELRSRISEVPEDWMAAPAKSDATIIRLHPQVLEASKSEEEEPSPEDPVMTDEQALLIDLLNYRSSLQDPAVWPRVMQSIMRDMDRMNLPKKARADLLDLAFNLPIGSREEQDEFANQIRTYLETLNEALPAEADVRTPSVASEPGLKRVLSKEEAVAWVRQLQFPAVPLYDELPNEINADYEMRFFKLEEAVHGINLGKYQVVELPNSNIILLARKGSGAMTMTWVYAVGEWLGFSRRGTEIVLAPILEAVILALVMAIPGSWKWFAAFHPDRDPKAIHEGVKHARHVFATVFLLTAAVVTSFDLSLPVIQPANIMQWVFYLWGASLLISGPGHFTWNAQHPDAAMTLGKAEKESDSLVMDARHNMRLPEILWGWAGLVVNRTRAALSPTYRQGLDDELESVEASLNETLESEEQPTVALVARSQGFARLTEGQPSAIQVNVFLPNSLKLRAAALVLAHRQHPGETDKAKIWAVAKRYVVARRDQVAQRPSTLRRVMSAIQAVGGRSARMTDLVPVAESLASSPKDQAGLSQHLNPFRQAFLQSA